MIELDDFGNNGEKKLRGDFWEVSDERTEFELYIDNVYLLCFVQRSFFFSSGDGLVV